MQRLRGRLREVVVYKNRSTGGHHPRGDPGKSTMEDNLLHAIRHVYFHVVTKVLRILKVAQCTQRAKRSENASSGRLQKVKKNRKSLSFQTQKVVEVGYRRYYQRIQL